jgi:hypothetical protein
MPPKLQLLASASGRGASSGLRCGAHVVRHSRVAWRPSKWGWGEGRCVLRPRHHRAWVNGWAYRCAASCRSSFVIGGKPDPSFKPTASGGGLISCQAAQIALTTQLHP